MAGQVASAQRGRHMHQYSNGVEGSSPQARVDLMIYMKPP